MPTAPPSEPTDAALVAASRAGDADAFDRLVRRHFRVAYAVALGVLGDAMQAEDACQDAFLRALEKLEGCREPERFAGWLAMIVRRTALNALRGDRRRRQDDLDEGAQLPAPAGGGDAAVREELRGALERALAGLPAPQREVVLLHDHEGWSHAEIARQLGCSEVMSRQHLFQARRRLRADLAAHDPRGGTR
ncbi:MAG: sigma-70 family RNA polymerase sigma factor [Gemmatimonadales bacterium]|nr:sigma-70 family RNA polymerase sigma factor [Gemmatimonadales bacterium]